MIMIQRMKNKGDHRPRNSVQYERVVEHLIMHKAKWTPRQISLLPSVSRPRSIIRQLRKSLEVVWWSTLVVKPTVTTKFVSVSILPYDNDVIFYLRGAWRDHCFPEPFSWFLHETGLESLKITSARCFLLKCQRKDSKKAKEHRQFRGVRGRWRTAPIDRTTFHACQRCRKNAVLAVFSWLWVSFGEKKPFVNSNASF